MDTCGIVQRSIIEDIKFKTKSERAREVTTLDELVRNDVNGTLETRLYRKQANMDQILNHSNYPNNHKETGLSNPI